MANIVSAVFDTERDAQNAVDWLRNSGVADSAISIARGHDGEAGSKGGAATLERPGASSEAAEDAGDMGKGLLAGTGIGAGVGALFGLAAAAIPGAGPFIAAGALANALGVTGGAAVAGAVVGAASGGIASALAHYGLNEAESNYYAGEIEQGGTFVGVDLDRAAVDRATVLEAFRRYNGRTAGGGSVYGGM
jgi:hypothetical protein